MATLDFDPHNHAPPVSADDEWADSHEMAESQVMARSSLPGRRMIIAPENPPERSRSTPEMGIHINIAMPGRRSSEFPGLDTTGESDADEVVKLEANFCESGFLAKQAIPPIPLEAVDEEVAHARRQGEGREWGRKSRLATRWIAAAACGVVFLVVSALAVNQVWLRDIKPSIPLPVAPPEESPIEQIVGFELEGSSEAEARQLLTTYARATELAEILPIVRNGPALAARLKLDWQPWRAPADWEIPLDAAWSVSADGGRNHGRLKGIKPDFSRFRAYFVREDDGLKLDWEATQGIGDASFDQLVSGQGTGGKIRAMAKLDYYHSDVFPEESYHSFRLRAPDGEQAIWAYSLIGSPCDEQLMRTFEPSAIRSPDKSELPITLRLEAGPDGCQKNQWIIGELLHIEWVSP